MKLRKLFFAFMIALAGSAISAPLLSDFGQAISTFVGATSGVNGTAGLVVAPAAGDQDKYLKGDGTWNTPAGGSSVLPEKGSVYTSALVSIGAANGNPATSALVTGLTFTPITSGDYAIDVNIAANIPAAETAQIPFALFNAATPTVPIPNSERRTGFADATAGGSKVLSGALNDVFTLTAGQTYQVRAWNPNAATGVNIPASGVNGRNSLVWQKVSGFVPVSGQSVDYVNITATANQSTALTVGSQILFNSPITKGNIPQSAGVFTLSAGKTYYLEGAPGIIGGTGTELIYQWRDITNNVLVGTPGNAHVTVAGRNVTATANITPATTITVRLEITLNTGVTDTGASLNRFAWANITQIGSSAVTTSSLAQVKAIMPAQAIPSNSFTQIAGTYNVIRDNASNFNASTGVFTAPRTAAYFVQAQITFGTTLNGFPQVVALIRNNSNTDTQNISSGTSTSNADASHPSASGMMYLTAGDTVRVIVYQNSAVAQGLVATPSSSNLSPSSLSIVEWPDAK